MSPLIFVAVPLLGAVAVGLLRSAHLGLWPARERDARAAAWPDRSPRSRGAGARPGAAGRRRACVAGARAA